MSVHQLFVTTALPYANGNFHIGHIMEYIQADIWVRFQRMQGHQVNFVCADDTHGAPIMIAAEKADKTPQQFVADIAAGRKPYLDGFRISFDNWHSTDAPENHELARQIYRDLRDIPADQGGSLIERKTIEQFFDPAKNMFLPDRFIKGECPKCHAKDQYGDNCEVCGAVYAPTDLIDPVSVLSGVRPELKSSEHFFFKLSDPRCVEYLQKWTQDGRLQPEVANKVKEWFSVRTNPDGSTSEGLGDWDISRDAPYFGIEIPDAPGKYFYVWLDAPIGYLASLKNLLDKRGEDYASYMAQPDLKQFFQAGQVANGRVEPDIKKLARRVGYFNAKVGRVTADIPVAQAFAGAAVGVGTHAEPLFDLVGHLGLQFAVLRPALQKLNTTRVGELEEKVFRAFELGLDA